MNFNLFLIWLPLGKVQMWRSVIQRLTLRVHDVLPRVFWTSGAAAADARCLDLECSWGVYNKLNQPFLHPWSIFHSGVDVFK